MRQPLRLLVPSLSLILALAPDVAHAQGAPSVDTAAGKFTIGGYVEAAYSYNFNNPSNGLTNYRGFDNRHNSFTLSNVVLDGQWEKDAVSGRVTLQAGHTPNTYYLAEPSSPGASGAGSADASTWKYIQQAYVACKASVGKGLTFQLGLFLSPIGIEGAPVKDDWNWSRSNLFFGLPFYHTGLRSTQQLTDKLALTIAIYNGWNSVVDSNPQKSVSAQFAYTDGEKLVFSVLYFGGVERSVGAPEGKPWRHLIDGWVQARIAAPLRSGSRPTPTRASRTPDSARHPGRRPPSTRRRARRAFSTSRPAETTSASTRPPARPAQLHTCSGRGTGWRLRPGPWT